MPNIPAPRRLSAASAKSAATLPLGWIHYITLQTAFLSPGIWMDPGPLGTVGVGMPFAIDRALESGQPARINVQIKQDLDDKGGTYF